MYSVLALFILSQSQISVLKSQPCPDKHTHVSKHEGVCFKHDGLYSLDGSIMCTEMLVTYDTLLRKSWNNTS
jgi:hypothetical protein